MSSSIREEFRPSKFGLGHHDPALFIRSQWRCPQCLYLLWRLFWLLWHVGWVIASPVVMACYQVPTAAEGAKWLIYLTNTTLILTTLACLVDFVSVYHLTYTRSGKETASEWIPEKSIPSTPPLKEDILFHGEFTLLSGLNECTTPWYVKLTWLLYDLVGSSNILVTIMYWVVVFDGTVHTADVVTNSVNSFFIITNALVTAMPWNVLHFIYPVAYGALYFLFTYIYYVAGGTDIHGRDIIYGALDWNTAYPTVLGVVIGVLVCVPIAHLLLFALYTLRLFLFSKMNSGKFELAQGDTANRGDMAHHGDMDHRRGTSREGTDIPIEMSDSQGF